MAIESPKKSEHKRVDIDASELTQEEWFFLRAVLGMKPGATLEQISEWQKIAFAKPRRQQMEIISNGMASLMARGFVVIEMDDKGSPKTDADGMPVFKITGNVVSRIRHVDLNKPQ